MIKLTGSLEVAEANKIYVHISVCKIVEVSIKSVAHVVYTTSDFT